MEKGYCKDNPGGHFRSVSHRFCEEAGVSHYLIPLTRFKVGYSNLQLRTNVSQGHKAGSLPCSLPPYVWHLCYDCTRLFHDMKKIFV